MLVMLGFNSPIIAGLHNQKFKGVQSHDLVGQLSGPKRKKKLFTELLSQYNKDFAGYVGSSAVDHELSDFR